MYCSRCGQGFNHIPWALPLMYSCLNYLCKHSKFFLLVCWYFKTLPMLSFIMEKFFVEQWVHSIFFSFSSVPSTVLDIMI